MSKRLFLAPVLACASSVVLLADGVNERIQRIESGLRVAIALKGEPLQGMNLVDRMRHYKVPAVSVAVITGGKVEWARGYGSTSIEGGKPVTPETLFQAASISKSVASLVALRLVEQGKLSLDEDVNLKLRSWKVPENEFTKTEKVTLRRLLNHSAGLTVHGFPGYEQGVPIPTLVQVLDGKKPANTQAVRVDIVPGTRGRYSGGGYEVMQLLVEDVTGRPFAQVARELVLQPLGMKLSTYEQPLPASRKGEEAMGHVSSGLLVKGNWRIYPEQAAAGLWTTPSDLARMIFELQAGGRVLKPESIRAALTKLKADYGLGFGLGEAEGRPSFSHGGANEGYRCQYFAYRNSGDGAVVMTNSDSGGELTSELMRSIAAEYGWPDHKQQLKAAVSVDAEILKSYTGDYQIPDGPLVRITFEEGHLCATAFGNKVRMQPESATNFFVMEMNAPPLQFAKKDNGVVEMTVEGFTVKRSAR